MFLSVFYYCISAFLCCRHSFNPSLSRLSFFLSQLQSLLLFVIHFHDNFNFSLAACGSEERRTTCCPITCFKTMSIVRSLPYQGLIMGWPPHKPQTLCCICKACFKRLATAVLSWLDCSSTAAQHKNKLVSDVEFNSVE